LNLNLQLLAEFLDSHDAGEASRCLRGLAVPFFHHELVKQGLHAAMENAAQTDHIMTLFTRCGVVSMFCLCV
jgi:hypothetical protein